MNIQDLKRNPYWLILLNVDIFDQQNITNIWNGAHKIVCTDGAVNKLRNHLNLTHHEHLQRGPDYVIGDLDSLKSDSLKWLDEQFGEGSYKIYRISDQDTTDFDKSLSLIKDSQENANVVALNCFGGRLDHSMAIINSAYHFEKEFNMKIEMSNEKCVARIVHNEYATISYDHFNGSNCGIIPLFGPVSLETSGLKWNLEKSQTVQFGGLISTSNRIINDSVTITNYNDTSYIWTHETK